MGKYLKRGFDLTEGECWKTEHRGACPICNDSKAKVASGGFMYSCDCVNETIYKLFDVDVDGRLDLLAETPDKQLIGLMINAMAEYCSFEIHEINNGGTKISRNSNLYSI